MCVCESAREYLSECVYVCMCVCACVCVRERERERERESSFDRKTTRSSRQQQDPKIGAIFLLSTKIGFSVSTFSLNQEPIQQTHFTSLELPLQVFISTMDQELLPLVPYSWTRSFLRINVCLLFTSHEKNATSKSFYKLMSFQRICLQIRPREHW